MRQLIVGLSLVIIGSISLLELLGIVSVVSGWQYISAVLIVTLGLYMLSRVNY
jgi:hypothetical protein